jgi:hypothetical protein
MKASLKIAEYFTLQKALLLLGAAVLVLNNFRRESVAFVYFRLCHEPNTGRLGINLSVST